MRLPAASPPARSTKSIQNRPRPRKRPGTRPGPGWSPARSSRRRRPAAPAGGSRAEQRDEVAFEEPPDLDLEVVERLAVPVHAPEPTPFEHPALGLAQLGEELGQRPRVEPRPEQPAHRLAVVADDYRRSGSGGSPRRAASSPSAPRRGSRTRRGAGRPSSRRRLGEPGRAGVSGGREQRGPEHTGSDDLVRDRNDREVLDRVDLRLDQQGDIDPDHVRDEEPDEAQHRLGRQRTPALSLAEPEPLVDGVEEPIDRLQERSRSG